MEMNVTAQATEPIRLVLVDEHPLSRAGLRSVLEAESDMEVIAATDSLDEALVYCRRGRPHVLLMDLDLPATALQRDVQRLRRECSDCAVVILAHRDDDEHLFRSVVAGANGHVANDAEPQEVAVTIRRAAAGGDPISEVLAQRPRVSQRVLQAFRELTALASPARSKAEPNPLTGRQLTVLDYAAQGLTNRQIARVMGFSEHTIKAEMSATLAELVLKHRTEAVVHALRRGWISLPDKTGEAAR
jgi:two-component system, NarL family, response regulator DegU